jgi:hypothetical protein
MISHQLKSFSINIVYLAFSAGSLCVFPNKYTKLLLIYCQTKNLNMQRLHKESLAEHILYIVKKGKTQSQSCLQVVLNFVMPYGRMKINCFGCNNTVS